VSPNLDALAKESVLFENAVSAAPWTKPSVASIFTSLLPQTHRVVDDRGHFWNQVKGAHKTDALPQQAVTLAEVLRGAGYRTAAFSANGWIVKSLGFGQGFEKFQSPAVNQNIFHADEVWPGAAAWLRGVKRDKPLFVYVHFMDTHGPWFWLKEDAEAVKDARGLGENRDLTAGELKLAMSRVRQVTAPKPGPALREWRAAYAAVVRAFDRRLGSVLDDLGKIGMLDDSIVIFTSDHGEDLLNHGWWGHGDSLHTEQLRVPLLVRMPGAKSAGRRIDGIVSLLDLMPTLLDAAGVAKPPAGMQGESFWGVLEGRAAPKSLSPYVYASGVKKSALQASIQDERYNFIFIPGSPPQYFLFDLKKDPDERLDIAAQDPEQLERFKDVLRRKLADLDKAGTLLEEKGDLSDEEIEKLKSLGYVD